METLANIFGGKIRVRVMRLFLLNPERAYERREVLAISRGSDGEVDRELALLEKAGLIKRKNFYRTGAHTKLRVTGWTLNQSFLYLTQLRNLLVNSILLKNNDIVKRLGRAGNLKLVVLAGIFIQNWDSRVDLLIVGDKLKRGMLERTISTIESEISRELRYAMLDTADFQYRLNIGDHLVRDIFDFPHQTVIDKLGAERSA